MDAVRAKLGLKAVYDVLLLVLYRNVPETVGARRPTRA
jgi:hypothetical protein